jgi:serine/threonine protein kinase
VGYIKIVDLGFCKKLPESGTTNTMCGTPEYIAPEMVQSKPHNRAVDLWAIGVFIYELITRCTPFQHTDVSGIYQRIIKSQEILPRSFKPGFPPSAKLAITRLLVNMPSLRIGMLRNGFDDIWSQPFFIGTNKRVCFLYYIHTS